MMFIHTRFDHGFGWIAYPDEAAERSSTALVDDGRVWLIDPVRVEGIDQAIAELGKVAGVIVTHHLHDRDAAWFATLNGVSVYVPRAVRGLNLAARVEVVDREVPGSDFRLLLLEPRGLMRLWPEVVVTWPAQRTIVCGDALGTAKYYALPDERLACHPVRRIWPPVELARLEHVDRLYTGHGPGITGDIPAAIAHAVATGRSGSFRTWRHMIRTWSGRQS